MLNHRFTTALFAVGVGVVFLCCKLGTPCFNIALALIAFLYLELEFLGAYFIGLNFHLKSLNYLDKTKSKIALTFDDGPCNPQTKKVLEVLKKHGVKATFFVIGKNIAGNEMILKQMMLEGHAIGSHSFSHHYWIDVWGKRKLKEDIIKSLDSIKEVIKQDVKIFRPPYGVTTPNFKRVLEDLDLRSIGWNVRSYDTSNSDINKVFERVISQTKNGSVILLHDRLDYMPELLDKLIPALKEKKFEFVTIE